MQIPLVPMVPYPTSVEALPDSEAARQAVQILIAKVQLEPERWPKLAGTNTRVARVHPHAALPEVRLYYRYEEGVIYLYGFESGPETGAALPPDRPVAAA
jgi:hypothetical protein